MKKLVLFMVFVFSLTLLSQPKWLKVYGELDKRESFSELVVVNDTIYTFANWSDRSLTFLKSDLNGDTISTKNFYYDNSIYPINLKNINNNFISTFNYVEDNIGKIAVRNSNKKGNIIWESYLDNNNLSNKIADMIVDDSYIYIVYMVFEGINIDNADIGLCKYNLAGNFIWKKVYEKPDTHEKIYSIEFDDNENLNLFYMKGYFQSFNTLKVKSEDGEILNDKLFEGPYKSMNVKKYEDKTYFVGQKRLLEYLVGCIDNETLDTLWTKSYVSGQLNLYKENRLSDFTIHENYLYAIGRDDIELTLGEPDSSRFSFHKLDLDGNLEWVKVIPLLDDSVVDPHCIVDVGDGFIVAAKVYETHMTFGGANYDALLIKVDYDGNITDITELPTPSSSKIDTNYPNPFNPTTTVEYTLETAGNVDIKVYNTEGKTVYELSRGRETAGTHRVEFNGANLPTGAYYYALYVDGVQVGVRKMLLVK